MGKVGEVLAPVGRSSPRTLSPRYNLRIPNVYPWRSYAIPKRICFCTGPCIELTPDVGAPDACVVKTARDEGVTDDIPFLRNTKALAMGEELTLKYLEKVARNLIT